jgi:acyl carrier protein
MFDDAPRLFTDGGDSPHGASPLHDMPPIERQIVCRLAERLGRDADGLAEELLYADPDLPVEERDLSSIIGALEDDFDVSLDPPGAAQVSYVGELAMLIRKRIGAPLELVARTPVRQPSARRRTRRRARAPRARRSASTG